ncbi:hypothetical protein PVAG01_05859 [Phlyctema vagabunda]|uniref:Uncharacterized protein n=1 Tax=Phlyctema vagabunda TaxID=108571 RepID=A0ABR4PEI8_9HELO
MVITIGHTDITFLMPVGRTRLVDRVGAGASLIRDRKIFGEAENALGNNAKTEGVPTHHDMATKVTSSGIDELERLQGRKDDLQARIQEKKDKMSEIRNAMKDGDTAGIMESSSTADSRPQGKEPSTISNEDLLKALEIAIEQLEEEIMEVDEELEIVMDIVDSA